MKKKLTPLYVLSHLPSAKFTNIQKQLWTIKLDLPVVKSSTWQSKECENLVSLKEDPHCRTVDLDRSNHLYILMSSLYCYLSQALERFMKAFLK